MTTGWTIFFILCCLMSFGLGYLAGGSSIDDDHFEGDDI